MREVSQIHPELIEAYDKAYTRGAKTARIDHELQTLDALRRARDELELAKPGTMELRERGFYYGELDMIRQRIRSWRESGRSEGTS